MASLVGTLAGAAGHGGSVLVGPESGDDAGVYQLGEHALVATVDFIPPVCDDARRFGRVAAANALSDIWAMGGEPLFALNLCSFPADLPPGVSAGILAGGAEVVAAAGAALLGGHTVRDRETKYGLAAVGKADPARLLTLAGARPGEVVVLTKPLGTGVLINAFKAGKLDEAGLEPALAEMERPNAEAARRARELGASAATDVTGFGLVGHAWNLARQSRVRLEIDFDALPVHAAFFELARRGVTTGCTPGNRHHVEPHLELRRELAAEERELLADPQTSGGLLLTLDPEAGARLVAQLRDSGHGAARIGRVAAGAPGLEVR